MSGKTMGRIDHLAGSVPDMSPVARPEVTPMPSDPADKRSANVQHKWRLTYGSCITLAERVNGVECLLHSNVGRMDENP